MRTLKGRSNALPVAIRPMADSPELYHRAHRHPLTVAAVVGSFAVAVGLVVRASGLLEGVETFLSATYQEAGFPPGSEMLSWVKVVVLLGLTYGMAWLVLEVPGTSRRLLVAGTVLVLTAAASPVAALWGFFWSPLEVLLCGGWSAFCATLWARQHSMPCEQMEIPGKGKVIPIAEEQERRTG